MFCLLQILYKPFSFCLLFQNIQVEVYIFVCIPVILCGCKTCLMLLSFLKAAEWNI
jgi:hypothetical protein